MERSTKYDFGEAGWLQHALDVPQFLYRTAFVILPPIFGILLVLISYNLSGQRSVHENLVWGLVYGFGWFSGDFLMGFEDRFEVMGFFGYLIWPIFVTVLLYR